MCSPSRTPAPLPSCFPPHAGCSYGLIQILSVAVSPLVRANEREDFERLWGGGISEDRLSFKSARPSAYYFPVGAACVM